MIMILCGIYNNIVGTINNYLYSNENKGETPQEEQKQEENSEKTEENKEEQPEQNNDESLTQSEVSQTEVSETERIKNTYAFILPVTRNGFVRIWDKGSNSKCCNSLS